MRMVGPHWVVRGAQVLIESWRRHYNTLRPHSSLGYTDILRSCSWRKAIHREDHFKGADHALTEFLAILQSRPRVAGLTIVQWLALTPLILSLFGFIPTLPIIWMHITRP